MKISVRSIFLGFVSLTILLSGCAPAATPVPPTSTALPTKRPFPSATPGSTQTLELTTTPVIPTEFTLDPCSRIVKAKVSDAGILDVVLEYEIPEPGSSDGIQRSAFGSENGTQHVNLSLWSEKTNRAVPIPLLPDSLNPIISTDLRWVLFRRDLENQSEFWVKDTEGDHEKKLATIILDEELKARYPDGMFSLDYGWFNVDMFYYEVDVTYGQIPPLIIDKFVLVDVNSGQAIDLANSLENGEVHFAPDGTQMAVATENEFYVLRTQDGMKQFTIRASLQYFMYSPDGNYIVDFNDEGILRINALDGQQLTIPLKYTTLVPPNPCCEIPRILTWISDSTFLFISLNSDQRRILEIELFYEYDPEMTFTVWQVDLEDGTAHSIQVFRGDPSTARFSPDSKLLAFQKFKITGESKTRDLYLADLSSGEILETITGGEFYGWLPGSEKYLYVTGVPFPPQVKGDPTTVPGDSVMVNEYLGQVGGNPILINWDNINWYDWWWVDENRLVTDCKIVTFP